LVAQEVVMLLPLSLCLFLSSIESFSLQAIWNQKDLFMPLIRFSMSVKDCFIWDGLEVDMMVVFEVDASTTGIYGLGAGDVVLAEIIAVLSVYVCSRRTKATVYW